MSYDLTKLKRSQCKKCGGIQRPKPHYEPTGTLKICRCKNNYWYGNRLINERTKGTINRFEV